MIEVLNLSNNIIEMPSFHNCETWPLRNFLPVKRKRSFNKNINENLGVCVAAPGSKQAAPVVFLVNLCSIKSTCQLLSDSKVKRIKYDSLEDLKEEWAVD